MKILTLILISFVLCCPPCPAEDLKPAITPVQTIKTPAWAERHPKLAMITGVRFGKAVAFAVRHPKQFGKNCETDGTNGLMIFMGALVGTCANVGTTAVVAGRRF